MEYDNPFQAVWKSGRWKEVDKNHWVKQSDDLFGEEWDAEMKRMHSFETIDEPKENKIPVDNINHPIHYKGKGGDVECIDAIKSMLTPVEFIAYTRAQAEKYIWRCGQKGDPIEDINKAIWYLKKCRETMHKLKRMEENHE